MFALSLLQAFHPAPLGGLIQIVILLAVLGLCLWLLFRFVPMEPVIKNVIMIVVVLVVILWLLRSFGII